MTPGDRAALVSRLRDAGCVFADDEADILLSAASSRAELAAMVDRRVGGSPLESVVGWAEFCGLRIALRPGVFVPRRRTELLVRETTRLAWPGAVVVDLCCGSGAVGVALAAAVDRIELYAVDIEATAVACARVNIGAGGRVYQGDLYDPLPTVLRGHVDIVVANPPYVPTDAVALMPPEARDHEPRVALDGGRDGLDVLRRVSEAAPVWLRRGGHLLIETSEPQTSQTVEIVARQGLVPRVVSSSDLNATVVVGTNSRLSSGDEHA